MTEIIETERLVLFPYTSENLALFNKDLDLFEKTYDVHYCGEELDGCGYMTEALTAFLNYGKKLGIGTVRADTTKENTRPQNVLRRCGFSFIGEDQNMWWEKKLLID